MAYHRTREDTLADLLELEKQGFDVSEEAVDRLRLEITHGKQIWDIEPGVSPPL